MMVPWMMQRPTLKHLARVTSRCRSYLPALVAVDDVSGTSYISNHGFWVTKMMCTAASSGKRRNKQEERRVVLKNSGPNAYFEEDKDEYRRLGLDYFPRLGRSELEIKNIFETWIMLFGKVYASAEEKKKRFAIFKCKVRFIEEQELTSRHLRLRLYLDYFSDMTPEEYFAMKDPTDLSDGNWMRSMSTPANMERNAGENDQISIIEKMKDSGAVPSEPQPPCLKEKKFYCLRDFPAWRSEEEIRLMFEEWNGYHKRRYDCETKEEREFKIFEERVRFVEEMTARNLGFRLRLPCFITTMTIKDYFDRRSRFRKGPTSKVQ